MNHFLNLEETQTDSLLKIKKKSELDYSDNSLIKISNFVIKIDTIPNLLEAETEKIVDSIIKIDNTPNLLNAEI